MATPKLSYHKTKGLYFARFDGRQVYFGKDHAEAAQRFAEALTLWRNGEAVGGPRKDSITVVEAADRYLAHAAEYYGPESHETGNLRQSLRRLCELFGREPLGNLSPKKLKTFQAHLVQQGELSRVGINRVTGHVKRFAKWCVSEELCEASVHTALTSVPGLRRGKTAAPEPESAHVPTEADIRAITGYMPGHLGDALLLQFLTGARPTELLSIRPQDVETGDSVWRIQIAEHKTAHHGHARTLYAGPEAQRILKPYLLREHDRPCFRPSDAYKARSERSTAHRRPNQKPTPRKTNRTLNDQYDVAAYRRALERACEQAGVTRFTPHKVRHAAATRFRREFGLDVCQRLLGHRHAAITEVYAQADETMAVQAMEKIG